MAVETLTITGIGINPYSVRGINQSYGIWEERSKNRVTINGALIDTGDDAFAKYFTTIACEDMSTPLFDGARPGQEITINCVADMGYDTNLGQSPTRPIVPGSQREIGSPGSGVWVYKPILTCLIDTIEYDVELWGKVYSWAIEARET